MPCVGAVSNNKLRDINYLEHYNHRATTKLHNLEFYSEFMYPVMWKMGVHADERQKIRKRRLSNIHPEDSAPIRGMMLKESAPGFHLEASPRHELR